MKLYSIPMLFLSAGAGSLRSVGLVVQVFLFCLCISLPVVAQQPNTALPMQIMGQGKLSEDQLLKFLKQSCPKESQGVAERIVALYISESGTEGINHDIAFAQMILETGFLSFQGLVTADKNNFCGLGATGYKQTGFVFPDEQTGVRAHVQHLKAYASTDPPKNPIVDPRYDYVTPKGRVATVYGLSGTWAVDPNYSKKLVSIMQRMYDSR